MLTYAYNAALYCSDCADEIIADLKSQNIADEGDTDQYPQAIPVASTEADSPQHCDNCNCFLENELTPDGREYVLDLIRQNITHQRGSSEVIEEWISFYDITLEELLN